MNQPWIYMFLISSNYPNNFSIWITLIFKKMCLEYCPFKVSPAFPKFHNMTVLCVCALCMCVHVLRVCMNYMQRLYLIWLNIPKGSVRSCSHTWNLFLEVHRTGMSRITENLFVQSKCRYTSSCLHLNMG